jgi:hypothetical protein
MALAGMLRKELVKAEQHWGGAELEHATIFANSSTSANEGRRKLGKDATQHDYALGVEHCANSAAVAVRLRDATPDATAGGLNTLAVLLQFGCAVHVAHALAQVEAGVLLVVDTLNLDEGSAHVLSVAAAAEIVSHGKKATSHRNRAGAAHARARWHYAGSECG